MPDTTPTPFLSEEASADGSCVDLSAGVILPEFSSDYAIYDGDVEELQNYLNNGGSISELITILAERGNTLGPHLSQIITQDVTRNGVPDIFIALTIAYSAFGDGETHLLMFRCVNKQYTSTILFRRAGAGSRAEGLYRGGGARILRIQDLNRNNIPDILFSANWDYEFGTFSEIYLIEWQGTEFRSLIEFDNELGETQYHINTESDRCFIVEDIDGDGIFELIPEDGAVYVWNGAVYTPASN